MFLCSRPCDVREAIHAVWLCASSAFLRLLVFMNKSDAWGDASVHVRECDGASAVNGPVAGRLPVLFDWLQRHRPVAAHHLRDGKRPMLTSYLHRVAPAFVSLFFLESGPMVRPTGRVAALCTVGPVHFLLALRVAPVVAAVAAVDADDMSCCLVAWDGCRPGCVWRRRRSWAATSASAGPTSSSRPKYVARCS